MTHSKDACSRVVSVTKAFGFINEWGPHYSEKFRTNRCTFVGSADTTACALIMRRQDGSLSAAYCCFTSWEEGPSLDNYNSYVHLQFGHQPEFQVRLDRCRAPEWFHNGEAVDLKVLAKEQNFAAAQRARMVCAGLPSLAALAYRSLLLAEAFKSTKLMVNEPMLWVPRRKTELAANSMEQFLAYVCCGLGPIHSPAYLRTNELIRSNYQVSPWDMFSRSGCRPDIMMRDFGVKPGLLGKLSKIVKDTVDYPVAMTGIREDTLPALLTSAEQKAFKLCIPWFFEDSEDYEVPEHKDSFIVARRTDTVNLNSNAYIPAKFLGFSIPDESELRQKMHLAEVSKQLPPQQVVELKPEPSEVPETQGI